MLLTEFPFRRGWNSRKSLVLQEDWDGETTGDGMETPSPWSAAAHSIKYKFKCEFRTILHHLSAKFRDYRASPVAPAKKNPIAGLVLHSSSSSQGRNRTSASSEFLNAVNQQ